MKGGVIDRHLHAIGHAPTLPRHCAPASAGAQWTNCNYFLFLLIRKQLTATNKPMKIHGNAAPKKSLAILHSSFKIAIFAVPSSGPRGNDAKKSSAATSTLPSRSPCVGSAAIRRTAGSSPQSASPEKCGRRSHRRNHFQSSSLCSGRKSRAITGAARR